MNHGKHTYKGGNVKAKKSYGQHFLKNTAIARIIARTVHTGYVPALMPDGSLDLASLNSASLHLMAAGSLDSTGSLCSPALDERASIHSTLAVLEIGPGMGVLTERLWEDSSLEVKMVEVDAESVIYLTQHFPERTSDGRLLATDFLKLDLGQVFEPGRKFVITGNFPYNISTEILFKLLENRELVPVLTGMFQKEVGERVCAKPGSKAYGIVSVLLQAYYNTEYLFTVEPCEFNPPPQVRSCVIRLTRNQTETLPCNEKLFTALVKKAFNQRRKTLRNALKTLEEEHPGCSMANVPERFLGLRAEQLSVEDYIEITNGLKSVVLWMKPVIAIIGPTASGKTALAVALARALNGEILSADSRQVYTGMDIGTGKDLDEYGEVPYQLIDIAPAGEEFNIFRYQQAFDRAYQDVSERGKAPILCGGSGLYITAALGAKTFREVPTNHALRAQLSDKTDEELARILSTLGPLHNHTDTETRDRCLRAIEILTYERENPAPPRSIPVDKIIGIYFEPEQLRQRILQRLDQRLEQGMVAEVRALLKSPENPQGLQPEQLLYYGLEYKFLTQYITGELTYEEMRLQLYHAICQFAKRQRTWFRKMEREGYNIRWLDGNLTTEEKLAAIESENFLTFVTDREAGSNEE